MGVQRISEANEVGGPAGQAYEPGLVSGLAYKDSLPPPGNHCTTNFDGEVLGHHAIAGCQISVHKLLGSKVGHAVRDLTSHLHHVTECWLWEAGVVLQARQRLVKVCPSPALCPTLLNSLASYGSGSFLFQPLPQVSEIGDGS